MKKIINLFILLLLLSCNTNSKSSIKNKLTNNIGKFKANLEGITYDVAVKCSNFNKDYFMFKSDLTDYKDSNGDGIVVSGYQKGNKIVLTITDQGNTFSSANVKLLKNNNSASGNGKLFKDGNSSITKNVSFEIQCN